MPGAGRAEKEPPNLDGSTAFKARIRRFRGIRRKSFYR
ncbi:hypothetical protein BURMUCGD1_3624 [Burkholderia multivorans CGD1]|nr:hypothetical protein BURMUCGD1_3624 [Burkholderia multivorans CGD1]